MARLESQAVAGYYPTPAHLLPAIARLVSVPALDEPKSSWDNRNAFTVVDPCAGEGEAVATLCAAWAPPKAVDLYAVEVERDRYSALHRRLSAGFDPGRAKAIHADAFCLLWEREARYGTSYAGADVLYLNPPYDTDPVHGRLESKFLARSADVLRQGGVLIAVVPAHALTAMADRLVADFAELRGFRFPTADFAAYRQVVIVGRRQTLPVKPAGRAALLRAAAEPETLPVLGAEWSYNAPPLPVLLRPGGGFSEVREVALDAAALVGRYRPLHEPDRAGRQVPVHGMYPDADAARLLERRYPLAMPPKAAHVAAGIAAGVFNGERVEPDDPESPLPPLLVKGSFDREFVVVDERTDREGNKTGETHVQQPRLVVTVFDLRAHRYHTVKSSTETTGATDVGEMTTADLLHHYGRGLMRIMLEHCPVLHDPADPTAAFDLPPLARPLFRAQADAVRAAVRLLGGTDAKPRERRGKAAFILGEIGSGKSAMALATALACGAARPLVMCPPHLLGTWEEQVRLALPGACVHVVSDIASADAFARRRGRMVVGVMSREAAKLGHAWRSVKGTCPRCGGPLPEGDLAGRRARCELREWEPLDDAARLARAVALRLMPVAPVLAEHAGVRLHREFTAAYADRPGAWDPARRAMGSAALIALALGEEKDGDGAARWGGGAALLEAVERFTIAADDATTTRRVVRSLFAVSREGYSDTCRTVALRLLLTVPADEELWDRLHRNHRPEFSYYRSSFDAEWESLRKAHGILHGRVPGDLPWCYSGAQMLPGGRVDFGGGIVQGSVAAAVAAHASLSGAGQWRRKPACGEVLYQAVPEPRRYPLATYLARRHAGRFDFLIVDEGHEYGGAGTAQGFAAQRLIGLGKPTVVLTGSVNNGYAESHFATQWAVDPEFRREFSRDDRADFVRRYGYVKQAVEDREDGKVVEWGKVSDRVTRTTRTLGNAPGVLPLFVLRYLLRIAVTLHKTDLALDLPGRTDEVVRVKPTREQMSNYRRLRSALVERIQHDAFGPDAGKLWGQMAELPSYLDRAAGDVGNRPDGRYVVAYPEASGGAVVAEAEGLDPDELLPKERWMIDRIRAEMEEDRATMVLAWHVELAPRLARLIERHLGIECPLLDAGRVPARKRQEWIDRNVVARSAAAMVVNPVAVQTGLNNLVHFSTQLWMENPGASAIVIRQASGRIDRIGQDEPTRVVFPVYEGTSQEALHRLLLHKVGVSMATDGLDAEGAMAAAGVGEQDGMSALAVGRQLYEMLRRV